MKNLKLKTARAAMDMSQQQLADAVGVTRQTIGMIEAGKYNPTLNLCIAICKALNKTLDELFWQEEEESAESGKSYNENEIKEMIKTLGNIFGVEKREV